MHTHRHKQMMHRQREEREDTLFPFAALSLSLVLSRQDDDACERNENNSKQLADPVELVSLSSRVFLAGDAASDSGIHFFSHTLMHTYTHTHSLLTIASRAHELDWERETETIGREQRRHTRVAQCIHTHTH